MDVDYAGPLIRFDAAAKEIYPAASTGQWKAAVAHALTAQAELTRFLMWAVQHKGKNT